MSKRLRKTAFKVAKKQKGRYMKRWEKREIGTITERKFFDEFPGGIPPRSAPAWIVSVNRHDETLDARGIDAVVKIKHFMGGPRRNLDIFLQIKTSGKYIDRFKSKHPSTRIAVLVIGLGKTARDFLPDFYALITQERHWLATEMKLLPYLSQQEAA